MRDVKFFSSFLSLRYLNVQYFIIVWLKYGRFLYRGWVNTLIYGAEEILNVCFVSVLILILIIILAVAEAIQN